VEQFIRMSLLIGIFCYFLIRIFYSIGLFKEEIKCGVEKTVIRKGIEYFEANGYRFDNAYNRSNETAFEGEYAVKLTPENQYGFSITLGTPKPGDEYEASVWVRENKTSADTSGWPCLVASVGSLFWKGTTDFEELKNGWGKLHLKTIIPEGKYKKEPLVIYCWNTTKNVVFFDDMSIKRSNYWRFFKQ
jgi:hypothetical protein